MIQEIKFKLFKNAIKNTYKGMDKGQSDFFNTESTDTVLSETPVMHCFCQQDGEPVRPGVAMTDLATGLYAHGAVMAALLQRHKTGRGVHIDCNLLSSQVS